MTFLEENAYTGIRDKYTTNLSTLHELYTSLL